MKDQNADFSDFESRLVASGNSAKVGKINDQRFYALRYQAGEEFKLPFARKKFSALINASGKLSETDLREIGLQLLRHGLACAVCIGSGAAQVSAILDELIDANNFSFDGFTPYTQIEDGTLSESLELFSLPTGLTDISLILTLGGNDDEHDQMIDALNHLGEIGDFADEEDDEDEELIPAFVGVGSHRELTVV